MLKPLIALVALVALGAVAACRSNGDAAGAADSEPASRTPPDPAPRHRGSLPRPEVSNMPTPAPGYEEPQPK